MTSDFKVFRRWYGEWLKKRTSLEIYRDDLCTCDLATDDVDSQLSAMDEEYASKYASNRERARAPKRGKFWCKGCDRQLVSEWAKCPVCGTHNNKKRLKKG